MTTGLRPLLPLLSLVRLYLFSKISFQCPTASQVLAGTAQHKLWLYDLKVGRRPQMDIAWGEAKITALAPEPDGETPRGA